MPDPDPNVPPATDPAVDPAAPPTGDPATPPADPAAEAAKWKALSRKHEDAAKANAAAAKRLAEIEDRDLSELQKAQKRAAELEAENLSTKSEAARLRIALKHGIPEEDFDLLGSGPEDAIEARAVRLAAKNAATKVPAVNYDGGPRPPADPSDLPGQIAAAEKAGDRQLARRLKAQQLHEARNNL